MLGTNLTFQPAQLLLLAENMGFHLIDGWYDLTVMDEIQIAFFQEIGDSYGTQFSLLIGSLHGPVDLMDIPRGFMKQQQVDIVQIQPFQRALDGTERI